MDKTNIVKAVLMLGGGFLVYSLVKSIKESPKTTKSTTNTDTKSFDSGQPTPKQMEDAKIVINAYTDAMRNNEPPLRLTELNKECMNEFGLRCYVDESGKTIVCDEKGNTILSQ
jgi:hypothetical protein